MFEKLKVVKYLHIGETDLTCSVKGARLAETYSARYLLAPSAAIKSSASDPPNVE
jgi:hypothetical protein